MKSGIYQIAALVLLLCSFPALTYGWGIDGHAIVCDIAEARFGDAATKAVKELLPIHADGNLSSFCSWADHVKFRYPWSSALHYINTPDVCNYNYDRDCVDEDGEKGRCVAGAIRNYTDQLLTYRNSSTKAQYNLTEALMFLSHLIGDIHQPLHAGFASDKGGNTIDVHWYRRRSNLHHVWDDNIIETQEKIFYDTEIAEFLHAIQQNITGVWSDQIMEWEKCSNGNVTCPDIYASESITAACNWAYKDVTNGSVLEDDYFYSRVPVVNLRLAQSGVRLAATLNRIFE